jgi:hypothetical protein
MGGQAARRGSSAHGFLDADEDVACVVNQVGHAFKAGTSLGIGAAFRGSTDQLFLVVVDSSHVLGDAASRCGIRHRAVSGGNHP